MLTDRVRRWRDEGAIEEVLGRKLFVRRRDGGDGVLLLFLHGFPSSSYDWRALLGLRPGVETIELPDAAHYPQVEQPELISAALDTALARASA